jgi:hypothetical protein
VHLFIFKVSDLIGMFCGTLIVPILVLSDNLTVRVCGELLDEPVQLGINYKLLLDKKL